MSLWDYIASVVSWVRSLYDNAIAYAKSIATQAANSIVNSKAGVIYGVVKEWIDTAYRNAINSTSSLIHSAWVTANSAWNWVQSAYSTVSNWIDARIRPIWDAVAETARVAYNLAREWSIKAVNQVVAWAEPAITGLTQKIKDAQEWIATVRGWISDQVKLFTSGMNEKIAAVFDDGWDTLSSFVFDPLNYVLAMIIPIFTDLLCYSVAYALGTEKESLPPWPKWSNIVEAGGGERPTPAPSGLIPPLSKMWVSGYRFTPGHRATDYGCESNCPVYACHAGTVEYSGWSSVGYGNCVTLRGVDWWTRYAHLLNFNVVVGQEIAAGHVLGGCDTTGNSTGNHLHLEIQYKSQFINPESVF